MMFYLLAVALCLAVFLIVMSVTLVLCSAAARIAGRALASSAPGNAANLLFSLHVLPFVFAGVVAFGVALPAFFELEPAATGEILRPKLAILAIGGALVVAAMAVRAIKTWRATTRATDAWRAASTEIRVAGFDGPVHCVEQDFPFLVVAGLLHPKIFVGRPIMQQLSSNELAAALAHEQAHTRSFDNFKQLWLKITRLPDCLEKLAPGKADWASLSEIAADEGALAGGASLLDLSSALVKVARLARSPLDGRLVASYFVPQGPATSLELRATRLERLLVSGVSAPRPEVRDWRLMTALAILTGASLYATCLSNLLPGMHEALEALVR